MQNEYKTKAMFSCLLRHPEWNGAGLFWIRKEKYKQEKKEASYKKQKEVSNKGNTHINNLYRA